MPFILVVFSVTLFASAFGDPLLVDLLNTVDGAPEAVTQTSQLDDIIDLVKVLPVAGDLTGSVLDITTNVVDSIVELIIELLTGIGAIDLNDPSVIDLIPKLTETIFRYLGGLPLVGGLASPVGDLANYEVEHIIDLLSGIGAIDPNDPSVNELIAELEKIVNHLVKGLPVVGDLAGGVLDTVTDITEGLKGETGETNPNTISGAN